MVISRPRPDLTDHPCIECYLPASAPDCSPASSCPALSAPSARPQTPSSKARASNSLSPPILLQWAPSGTPLPGANSSLSSSVCPHPGTCTPTATSTPGPTSLVCNLSST